MGTENIPSEIKEGLRRMNFEDRMEEARIRRAKILAERARQEAPKAPRPPRATVQPQPVSEPELAPRHATVPLERPAPSAQPEPLRSARTEPKLTSHPRSAPVPHPKPSLEMRSEPSVLSSELPVLVLDDACQVRSPSNTYPVASKIAQAAALFRSSRRPATDTDRKSTEFDHGTGGAVSLAIAAVLAALTFGPGLRTSTSVDLAGPVLLPADPEHRVVARVSRIEASQPRQTTELASLDADGSIDAAVVVSALIAPFVSSLDFPRSEPERVVRTDVLPSDLSPLETDASPSLADATPNTVKVRIIVPETVPDAEATRVVAEIDRAEKTELDAVAEVDFAISATHVRYYHPNDKSKAEAFAREIGGDARDFTEARVLDQSGYLEVYIKGASTPVPEQSPETTAQVERSLDQILKEVLRRN